MTTSKRTERIMNLLREQDKEKLSFLSTLSYESTKGTDKSERKNAVEGWNAMTAVTINTEIIQQFSGVLLQKPNDTPPVYQKEAEESVSSNSSVMDDEDGDPTFLPQDDIQSDVDNSDEEEPEIPISNNINYCENITHNPNDCGTQSTSIKTKRVREKDFCYYCETYVVQFARHIKRNHSYETEVQKILSVPVKSKARKNLIASLRKKGNYIGSSTGVIRPVRKPEVNRSPHKLLPCTYCLGFYVRRQLWRHRKTCSEKPEHDGKSYCQREGQNFLINNLPVDQNLKDKVFPRMAADKISLTAKKDTLITLFGARYLKIHKEKHQISVTSRKMRELARLLIEIKKKENDVKSLFDSLRPKYFDVIVEAAKSAAKYDKIKDKYGAPTYAMNISTSLKECCEIGITYSYKLKHRMDNREAEELESELKTMILLLKSNWKYEVSHHAANDLHINKMNAVTIIPLASDIKKFRQYLIRKGEEAFFRLKNAPEDECAYKDLLETVYCRVLILCRKRGGELSRLPLKLYQQKKNNQTYEEFSDALQPTEKILMKNFKRVVIQGKRKSTPVLFSIDVQKHIELLINVRDKLVKGKSPYLFCNINTLNPIIGYKVLAKHAQCAELKNPSAITSKRLRKHLATISQIFSMSDQDLEQLSTFMGHTAGVHRSEYRLPDDVYQTAKVSKMLMMMENGLASNFKGKTLDEIDVNIEENLIASENEGESSEEEYQESLMKNIDDQVLDDLISNKEKCTETVPNTAKKSLLNSEGKKKKRVLIPWTEEQKKVVIKFFKTNIDEKRPPKRRECDILIQQHSTLLANKNWLKIKVFIQNIYSKNK